eukprot:CAMPEP_0115487502 /NCGR_PEP_ID=MMETSP0271-20121206/60988_1 /TAXON_ID=71861 /ORGANISM="Scrippsiella trochoidea, Strain CCMP3099" /LENGTH=79 /DNA_ID=CAMNT_0002915553 /DNA_START=11 /DNA_END=250 /DNA_ORIENTATION=-
MSTTLKARKMIAPNMPGIPPLPSGAGLSSSTGTDGALLGATPLTAPMSTGPLGLPGNKFFSIVPGLWMQFHSSVASFPA